MIQPRGGQPCLTINAGLGQSPDHPIAVKTMPDHNPFIRRGTPADSEMLALLAARTFTDAFLADNRPEDIAAYVAQAFTPQQMQWELVMPESVVFLAYHEATLSGQPLGYAQLRRHAQHPNWPGRQTLELNRLYVEQRAIGQGYGAALMQVSLAEAITQHCDTLWLGVWEHNRRAQGFYQRWGFKTVDSQTFVLGEDIQTDWVMERPVQLPDQVTGL